MWEPFVGASCAVPGRNPNVVYSGWVRAVTPQCIEVLFSLDNRRVSLQRWAVFPNPAAARADKRVRDMWLKTLLV